MFLLTSSEILIGSLISKIHVTNFEIFKITYFLGGVCVLFTIRWNCARSTWDSEKKFVNLMQIISNQGIAIEWVFVAYVLPTPRHVCLSSYSQHTDA